MKVISASIFTDAVYKALLQASYEARSDVKERISEALKQENNTRACDILHNIQDNHQIAHRYQLPLCQDTGIDSIYVSIGQDVHIEGDIAQAINVGIHQATLEGCLRASVVKSPLERVNTHDNTPAQIYYDIMPGDHCYIDILPKGAGCENVGATTFLLPGATIDDMEQFVLETVKKAGGKACPPFVISVCWGGDGASTAYHAKKAFLRDITQPNSDAALKAIEEELCERINQTNIGPMGLGGQTTCLKVLFTVLPCHIASSPLVVNISCHALRSAHIEIGGGQ